jgi:hypothetical protein
VAAGVIAPHIKNRLVAPVTVDGITDNVHLPTAELDWSGAPRFELGYRFFDGCGEAILAYRSLVSDGHAVLEDFDVDGGTGLLRSRLNLNVIDIDYGSPVWQLSPLLEMKGRVGARLASVYFDSLAVGQVLEQRTSNDFRGGGIHGGFELNRHMPAVPGLSLYGRVDGAAVIGEVRQGFEETFLLEDGSLIGGATEVHNTRVVPVLELQAGLAWTPAWAGHWFRLVGGYEFERWWDVGHAGGSNADLTAQGLFIRAEWGF